MTVIKPTLLLLLLLIVLTGACKESADAEKQQVVQSPQIEKPTYEYPPTLSQIIDSNNTETESPLKNIDFTNFSYPLPRGWQDADGGEVVLQDGKRPVTEERIGMQYLTTHYFDVTRDDEDEAFVILLVDTGGSAIPLIVYIFGWKDNEPVPLWYFRTGDRADGGLKRIFPNAGDLGVELFGRDRYIFNQMETSKIVGDEQQLCCPTHFTRTTYVYKGNSFQLNGDRLTYSTADPNSPPQLNLNEKKLEEERERQ